MTAHSRPYEPSDLAACLALFDGNTLRFFAPQEEQSSAPSSTPCPRTTAPIWC